MNLLHTGVFSMNWQLPIAIVIVIVVLVFVLNKNISAIINAGLLRDLTLGGLVMIIIRSAFTISITFQGVRSFEV